VKRDPQIFQVRLDSHRALLTSSILILGFVARVLQTPGIFFAIGNQTLASKEASYNFARFARRKSRRTTKGINRASHVANSHPYDS